MAAKIQETITQTIRDQDGITTTDTMTTNVFMKYEPVPQFSMLMNGCVDHLTRAFNLTELRLLIQIGSRINLDSSMTIDLSPHVRKVLCESLQITRKTLSNALTTLRKKGLLLDSEDPTSSLLYMNPHYFFKGSLKSHMAKCTEFLDRQCKMNRVLAS
jgi:hypothetical protein